MKITCVTISRNDNYGGNLIERAYYALYSMYNAYDEIFYIDWNSPGKSLFDEVKKDLPKRGKFKHIPVRSDFVRTLRLPHNAQVCTEVLARNIGIRRASHSWIVSTNIDVIQPLKLNNGFDTNTFYVFARRDITLEDVKNISSNPYNVQKYLQRNLYNYQPHGYSAMNAQDKWSLVDCCGDFQFASRQLWFRIRGFEEEFIYRGFTDTNVQRKASNAGAQLVVSFDYPVFHIYHQGGFGGTGGINDGNRCVINFNTITNNPDTWGFSRTHFDIEVW